MILKNLHISYSDVPKELESFFEKNNIMVDDIPSFLEEVIKKYANSLDFYASTNYTFNEEMINIGQYYVDIKYEYDLPNEINDLVEVLSEDDIDYIERNCDYDIDLESGITILNITDVYPIMILIDDLKKYSIKYAKENNLIGEDD